MNLDFEETVGCVFEMSNTEHVDNERVDSGLVLAGRFLDELAGDLSQLVGAVSNPVLCDQKQGSNIVVPSSSIVPASVYDTETARQIRAMKAKLHASIQAGTSLLDAFRDELIARFAGECYGIVNGNVSYFVPTDVSRGVKLVKSRAKSVDSAVRKASEGKPVLDYFGVLVVADTWQTIDQMVRPFIEDRYLVAPKYCDFYRDNAQNLIGYSTDAVKGQKTNGYYAEHMLVLYPVDGKNVTIPIKVHLADMASFLDAEYGKASLKRHLEQDLGTVFQLASLMGISDEVLMQLFERNADVRSIIGSKPGRVYSIGKGYASHEELMAERLLERVLPTYYKGIKRFQGEDTLADYPPLDSEEARAVVSDIVCNQGVCSQGATYSPCRRLPVGMESLAFTRLTAIADCNRRMAAPYTTDKALLEFKERMDRQRLKRELNSLS